ncbi:MAG TPA: hypothetical protein DEB06_03930 [Phycisphaerales bacterium]|nr:hypothetical protein [Phycisphaerales bacterium]
MPGPETIPPGDEHADGGVIGTPPRVAVPPRRSGFRVGPMVFVPEFRRIEGADPWAHRKGEPRPFALLWAVYLSAAALLTIFAVSRITVPSTGQFVYACRAMLVMVNLGAVVLWPMTRLSQQFPARPARSLLTDLAIVVVPAQAVVWPMPLLAHWDWGVTAAQSASSAAWASLVGAVLMLATRHPSHSGRSLAMLACLGVALAAPALLVVPVMLNRPASADLLLWFSPLTTPYVISAAPSGHGPVMATAEWLLVLAPLPAALGLWLLGGTMGALPPHAPPHAPPLAPHSYPHPRPHPRPHLDPPGDEAVDRAGTGR